jgi:hypothetical protein
MGEEMTEVWRKDSGDAKTVCAIAIHLRYFSETWKFFQESIDLYIGRQRPSTTSTASEGIYELWK